MPLKGKEAPCTQKCRCTLLSASDPVLNYCITLTVTGTPVVWWDMARGGTQNAVDLHFL